MKANHANQYLNLETQATEVIRAELVALLEPYWQKIVIVGGSVPAILVQGQPKHLGTLDIDLLFDLNKFKTGEYSQMMRTLKKAGYTKSRDPKTPFRLVKTIEEITIPVDFLAPTSSLDPLISSLFEHEENQLSAAPGLNIALHQPLQLEMAGHQIKIASLPAILATKGYSMNDNRRKDAYDIWYILSHPSDAPKKLGIACQAYLEITGARAGYQRLAGFFQSDDDLGPQWVAAFLQPEQLEPEQIMQDAYQRVGLWAETLGI
jgi:hypothetical protein